MSEFIINIICCIYKYAQSDTETVKSYINSRYISFTTGRTNFWTYTWERQRKDGFDSIKKAISFYIIMGFTIAFIKTCVNLFVILTSIQITPFFQALLKVLNYYNYSAWYFLAFQCSPNVYRVPKVWIKFSTLYLLK